jgi:hypothetical protein
MTLALMWHENIQFLPSAIAALAEKHSTKEQRIATETMEGIVKDAATVYKDADWIEDNFGGGDTLLEIKIPLAKVLALLRDGINRDRLITQLLIDGTIAPSRIQMYDELLGTLEAILKAARKAHRGSQRGRPSGKLGLVEACERLARNYEIVFGKPVTNGWTKEKPIRPDNPATKFIFDILFLIDQTRTRLAEDLQDAIEKYVAKTPGKRRGRRDR